MKLKVIITGEPERSIISSIEILRLKIIQVLREACIEAYTVAKQSVPVRTGNLYRSIKIETSSPLEYKIVAGHPIKEKGKPYYAPFVEFGTRRMPPRPFMRPAYSKAIQTIKSKL